MAIANDITERKVREAQFQARQERRDEIAHALDLVPAMVRKLNGEVPLLGGRGLEALYGWREDEATGRCSHEFSPATEFPFD